MIRTAVMVLILGLLILLGACSGPDAPGREPEAPDTQSLPEKPETEEPAVEETIVFEPAEPALVDMSEAGGSAQAEEEEEMEGGGLEAPAPGLRDPLAKLVEQARQTLAERVGVTLEDVTVQSTEDVTWPDASLGCPDPEMMYAQALTPGYRIVLKAGGKTYTFHSDERDQIVLCGKDGRPVR